MAPSDHLTWEDLLEEEAPAAPPAAAAASPSGPAEPVSEELRQFLHDHERLRGELERRIGTAPAAPEDQRLARMYPVKVHTPESRIEERRLRRRDEAQALLKRHVLAELRIEEAQSRRDAEARARALEELQLRERLRAAWEARQADLLAAAARRHRAEERLQTRLDARLEAARSRLLAGRALSPQAGWEGQRDRRREQQAAARREGKLAAARGEQRTQRTRT